MQKLQEQLKNPESFTYEEEGFTPQEMKQLTENAIEIGQSIGRAALNLASDGVDLLISASRNAQERGAQQAQSEADQVNRAAHVAFNQINTPGGRLGVGAASIATSFIPAGLAMKDSCSNCPIGPFVFFRSSRELRDKKGCKIDYKQILTSCYNLEEIRQNLSDE